MNDNLLIGSLLKELPVKLKIFMIDVKQKQKLRRSLISKLL